MKTFPRWLRAGTLLAALTLGGALHAQEIVVSAAASLTNAFQAVGQAFEKAHPGAKITFNFAASGALLAQMQQGAPVDVFASADQETMNRAATAKLLADGTRVDFVQNTLVLIVPAAAAATPQKLDELAGAAYRRISTGTPASVPVGRYTMQAVQQAGVSAALEPKWIYGESVRQVLNYVARGEVDAGFVYRTDAMIERDKTRIALTVPTATPVSYPIAVLAGSKNAATARDFVAFVRGAQGQQILDGFGFSKPLILLTPLWLTLKVALLATLLAGAAGIALAWAMSRRRFVGQGILDAILMLPMVLPPTVLGYYLIVLIGRKGVFGQYLDRWFGINLIFTWQGAVIAAAIVSLPLIYKAARAAFEEVDGRLAHAARTLGAGEFEVFLRIALPLAVRGIAAGLMLAFARAMGEFGATLMIAGNLPGKTQTLSIAVYDAVQAGNDAQALWLTLVISLVCMTVLVISGRLLQARH